MLKTLCSGLWVALTLAALPATAKDALELKSVSVTLPPGDAFYPDGPNAEAINNNCLACHSADMVLTQPPLSKTAWTAEVNKMRNTFKAPIAAEDVDAIVSYLTAMKVGQ